MAGGVGADVVWRSAVESVLADYDGQAVRRSQGLWALAVRAESPGADVRCGGDVFGPVLTPGGFVVMRCWVRVEAGDPAGTRDACDAAWLRWARVDDYGVESAPDPQDEDPGPFGYPVVDGVAVVLAFDAREDEDPFPHRALTCLRILIEELRRHGCTPARLVNALHLPDDAGVDVEVLADELAASGEPRTGAGAAGSPASRPSWLPAFHEVDRARAGRPGGPAPFVLLAAGNVLAWDPHRGLMKLPRAEPESAAREVTIDQASLTADGTGLHYRRLAGPASVTPGQGRGLLDICSGAVSVKAAGATKVFESDSGEPRLEAQPPPYGTPPEDRHWRYRLVDRSGHVRDLPLRDNLVRAAKFSPTGRLLLTSHHSVIPYRNYVVCTDVATGEGREYDAVRQLGTAPWSPDETRLLIKRGNGTWVLDLHSGQGEIVDLDPFGPDEPTSPSEWEALGWLDDHGLLMSLRHGRRIRLAYQPLEGHTRHHILDIPATASQAETEGIALAPALLRTSPHLIGYHPQ